MVDPTKGDPARGGEIFRVNCAMCHNFAGAGGALTRGKYAPSLFGTTPKHIYEAMVTGPQSMPVFNDPNIAPTDKRDIIAYLKATQDAPEPRAVMQPRLARPGHARACSPGSSAWASSSPRPSGSATSPPDPRLPRTRQGFAPDERAGPRRSTEVDVGGDGPRGPDARPVREPRACPPTSRRLADLSEAGAPRAERQVAALFSVSILGTLIFIVAYFAIDPAPTSSSPASAT